MWLWQVHVHVSRITHPAPLATPSISSLPSRKHLAHNDAMNFREKIVPWDQLPEWRDAMRRRGKRLVATNGCFDLLHLGHVTYLENARNQGDALLIGLNGDGSVRELKGPNRPLNDENDRAAVLAALASVDGVCIFAERTATRFLAVAQPDIYVKGGDYTLETLNPEERKTVEQAGGRIVIIPLVPGKSTTALLKQISRL
jgi:rfaE bifunctional protein nucleotidyltransferase chain/domain